MDAQKVFKSTFKALINEEYSIGIDIERYQGVLEHALSKVDFSVGIGIYMLPSNLILNIRRTKGYNNKILVSNTDMKIGSNRDINRDHKNLTPPNVPKKIVIPAVQHKPPHNLKMLTEKHNDEKLAITLLIVGTGLIAYHFWLNALAFSGTNFVFSRLTDHGAEERKRHDLALEKLQRVRDEWNRDQMKRLALSKKDYVKEMRQGLISNMLMKQCLSTIAYLQKKSLCHLSLSFLSSFGGSKKW